jgi:circadian clock protein KaiC
MITVDVTGRRQDPENVPNPARPPMERLRTGSPHLDDILGGGFPTNSINILMGEPGSGKTILAERLIFTNAVTGGRPILYLTTLSEPLDKVVRYLQRFSFYDEEKLASGAIIYDSIGAELAEKGVGALVPWIRQAIQTYKPKVIVIDSFKVVHDLAGSVPEMRRMLFELAGLLTAYETTAFLIGEYGEAQVAALPEFAVADAIIELARSKTSTRDERYLRVLKLRGSSYLQGSHGFRILADGLDVFTRLVSPEIAPSYEMNTRRAPTSIAGVDRILEGGPFLGTLSMLLGPTGAGKTTFALQFVAEGLRRGDRCLYVNFEENPDQLGRQLGQLGIDPRSTGSDLLQLLYVSPVELQIDSIVASIFRLIQQGGVRRIVIDALGNLLSAATDQERLQSYLYALSQHFAVNGIASLVTYEAPTTRVNDSRISAISDNIFVLGMHLGESPRRTFQVIKARGIAHDIREHAVTITANGLEVA